MDLSEFKAFVRGMEHGFEDGMPSLEQWKVIKAELAKVVEPSPVSPSLTWPTGVHTPNQITYSEGATNAARL